VNLQGARGILVNITAGIDLSLGEYSEVGSTIEEFASPDATVVVGTVIDPELTNELRVTVVATGLGEIRAQEARPPRGMENIRAVASPSPSPVRQEPRPFVPAQQVARPRPQMSHTMPQGSGFGRAVGADTSMDYLDIPAFLRRQAD
jgi:cell division protein FtsZ